MKPILFNTEMVKAILQGRKTVTRRLVKPQPEKCGGAPICCGPEEICREGNSGNWYCAHCGNNFVGMKAPYLPGDILWVRETWAVSQVYGEGGTFGFDCSYKAGGVVRPCITNDFKRYCEWGKFFDKNGWIPSLFMPREAARIFLRVVNVCVERVQDITEAGAEKEGAVARHERSCDGVSARIAFAELWDSTVKRADLPHYGWCANPWVWVIELERCERGVTHD